MESVYAGAIDREKYRDNAPNCSGYRFDLPGPPVQSAPAFICPKGCHYDFEKMYVFLPYYLFDNNGVAVQPPIGAIQLYINKTPYFLSPESLDTFQGVVKTELNIKTMGAGLDLDQMYVPVATNIMPHKFEGIHLKENEMLTVEFSFSQQPGMSCRLFLVLWGRMYLSQMPGVA